MEEYTEVRHNARHRGTSDHTPDGIGTRLTSATHFRVGPDPVPRKTSAHGTERAKEERREGLTVKSPFGLVERQTPCDTLGVRECSFGRRGSGCRSGNGIGQWDGGSSDAQHETHQSEEGRKASSNGEHDDCVGLVYVSLKTVGVVNDWGWLVVFGSDGTEEKEQSARLHLLFVPHGSTHLAHLLRTIRWDHLEPCFVVWLREPSFGLVRMIEMSHRPSRPPRPRTEDQSDEIRHIPWQGTITNRIPASNPTPVPDGTYTCFGVTAPDAL